MKQTAHGTKSSPLSCLSTQGFLLLHAPLRYLLQVDPCSVGSSSTYRYFFKLKFESTLDKYNIPRKNKLYLWNGDEWTQFGRINNLTELKISLSWVNRPANLNGAGQSHYNSFTGSEFQHDLIIRWRLNCHLHVCNAFERWPNFSPSVIRPNLF